MDQAIHGERTSLQKFVDGVGLPIRALFCREKSNCVFTSLRDERMSEVQKYCFGRVLDLGCGPDNIFIRKFCAGTGIGADVFPYRGVQILVTSKILPFRDQSFDTVTLIAVGGHIPTKNRVATFKEIHRVLRIGGRLVMTEGEIITQTIHHKIQFFFDNFRKSKNPDTVRGMKEGEQFAMPHSEIRSLLSGVFGNTRRYRFQLRLNNVYIADRRNHP